MEHDRDIINLYRDYYDQLRPFIAYVEAKTERFPIGILNEVRALYDHSARLYLQDMSPENRKEELNKAQRHISRAKLDCYKVLCARGEEEIEEFKKNYKNVKLGLVDSGRCLPEFTRLTNDAWEKTKEAKESEKAITGNEEEMSNKYQEAIVAYEEIDRFIKSNAENLAWSSSHQKRYIWKSHLVAFFLGIIGSLLAAYVYSVIKAVFLDP